jgi:GGDEF domain-containing protein
MNKIPIYLTMSSLQKLTPRRNRRLVRRGLVFEKIMALLALANLILVLFDLSYIPFRDFWLQGRLRLLRFTVGYVTFPGIELDIPLPPITRWYDPIKGIEPYRDTQQYLQAVDRLEEQITETSIQSQEVESILQDLRRRSEEIIDTNPFQLANKTGTLEKIKNQMREYVFGNKDASAKEAFGTFWNQEYLANNGVKEQLIFFNTRLRPLFETNYYRPIGENGEFIDHFGLIDFPFVVLFALEFLGRTWVISRRHTGVSWRDAMLWRWYDIFLLLPILRWLRIIPVIIRLNQAELIDLNGIQKQVSQGFVASIAEDITEVVVVRVINQAQSSIQNGDIVKWLSQKDVRPYIDINNTDEVAALTTLMMQLMVYQVLPKIQPDIEALLQHNLNKAIQQSSAYQNLSKIPGLGQLEQNLTERLAKEITQAVYDGLNAAMVEDPVGDQLIKRLIEHLSETLGTELQAQQTLHRVQSLLTDLLEEIKINYVERLSEEDFEAILEQTRAIRQIAQH